MVCVGTLISIITKWRGKKPDVLSNVTANVCFLCHHFDITVQKWSISFLLTDWTC